MTYFPIGRWKHKSGGETPLGLGAHNTIAEAEAAGRESVRHYTDITFERVVEAATYNEAKALCNRKKK